MVRLYQTGDTNEVRNTTNGIGVSGATDAQEQGTLHEFAKPVGVGAADSDSARKSRAEVGCPAVLRFWNRVSAN